ncbi:MAG: CHAD domain-containing protein, partial [Planctomycetaceae bacterium]|nr:CHAD domain-containing protein [Planctomycetaceae bacterium]
MALGVPEAELTPPRIPPGAPVAVAIRSALEIGLRRIRINDPPARLGDVEGVHRLRTSVRRLRSVLRVFRGLVDPDWSEPIEAELKWLARWLGDVRDVDVMNDRLRQSAGELADALGPLFAALDRRHARASEALRSVLEGERYRSLQARLAEAAVHPALRDDARAPCRS